MDRTREQALLELLAYMLSSARQLPGEPARYGPIRLVESSIRLLRFLEHDRTCDWLPALRSGLEDTVAESVMDSEEFVRRLDGHLEKIVSLLVFEG